MAIQDMKPDIPWMIKNQLRIRQPAEPAVWKLVKKSKGNLFIDIGSNRGTYSELAKKRFKRVVSIDPNPKWEPTIQAAISDKTGWADFHFFDYNGSADSLIKNPHILGKDYLNDNGTIQVQTIKYDDLALDADLVKIDVEDAELLVIAGMEKHRPKKIIIEIHDERKEVEIISKLSSKGYVKWKIDSTHWLFSLRENPEDDTRLVGWKSDRLAAYAIMACFWWTIPFLIIWNHALAYHSGNGDQYTDISDLSAILRNQ